MTALSINPVFDVFTGTDGAPLDSGYLYIGTAGLNPETNPIQVYFDSALTIPAAQPIRTLAGYPVRSGTPTQLYVDAVDYSLAVKDKNGALLYTALTAADKIPAAGIAADDGAGGALWTTVQGFINKIISSAGAAVVGFIQAGAGAIARTVQSKCREVVSVTDFGADVTGVADSTAAFTAAMVAGTPFVPAGTYKITGTVRGVFYSLGPVTITTGTVTSIIDLSRIGANFRYNDGANLLRALRAGSLKIGGGLDCRGDAFFDTTGVNAGASINESHDSRGAYEPTRSGSATAYSDLCDSLATWTTITVGTGAAAVVADPEPDPAVGNVFDFTTGATLASIGGAQKDVGSIPASYGFQFLVKLNAVGANSADALEIALGNINTYNTILRLYNGAFEVFQDGAYRLLFAHGGNFWTEWWVEVTQLAGASHRVDLYAGTQLVGSRTGNLPAGATDGLLVFQQKSGVTINRESRIAVINIGSSQLADNMTLVGAVYPARFSPTIVRAVFLIEDTSVALNTNVNLTAQLSQNGGVAWENVTLQKVDLFSLGVVDSAKNIWILIVEHKFANIGAQEITWKLTSSGNWWFAVTGAYMEWI